MALLQTRQGNAALVVGVQPTDPASDPIPVTLAGGGSGILKGEIFNTAVLVNTNFFVADLAPSNPPTRFRIYVAMSVAGIPTVIRTTAGVAVNENLNGGVALNANAAYMFDISVTGNDTINLQFSAAAQILSCIVVEVGA